MNSSLSELEKFNGLDTATTRNDGSIHPILVSCSDNSKDLSTALYRIPINSYLTTMLDGHRINNRLLFPAALYYELTYFIAKAYLGHQAFSMVKTKISSAIDLAEEGLKQIGVRCTRGKNGVLLIQYSSTIQYDEQKVASFEIRTNINHNLSETPQLDHLDSYSRIEQDRFYSELETKGYNYSGLFNSVRDIFVRDDCIVARLSIDESLALNHNYFRLTSLLDGCLQLASVSPLIGSIGRGSVYVPVSINPVDLRIGNDITDETYAVLRRCQLRRSGQVLVCDIDLFDHESVKLFSLKKITYIKTSNEAWSS